MPLLFRQNNCRTQKTNTTDNKQQTTNTMSNYATIRGTLEYRTELTYFAALRVLQHLGFDSDETIQTDHQKLTLAIDGHYRNLIRYIEELSVRANDGYVTCTSTEGTFYGIFAPAGGAPIEMPLEDWLERTNQVTIGTEIEEQPQVENYIDERDYLEHLLDWQTKVENIFHNEVAHDTQLLEESENRTPPTLDDTFSVEIDIEQSITTNGEGLSVSTFSKINDDTVLEDEAWWTWAELLEMLPEDSPLEEIAN